MEPNFWLRLVHLDLLQVLVAMVVTQIDKVMEMVVLLDQVL